MRLSRVMKITKNLNNNNEQDMSEKIKNDEDYINDGTSDSKNDATNDSGNEKFTEVKENNAFDYDKNEGLLCQMKDVKDNV